MQENLYFNIALHHEQMVQNSSILSPVNVALTFRTISLLLKCRLVLLVMCSHVRVCWSPHFNRFSTALWKNYGFLKQKKKLLYSPFTEIFQPYFSAIITLNLAP